MFMRQGVSWKKCGKESLGRNETLRSGGKQSCGCLSQESRSKNGKSNTGKQRVFIEPGRVFNRLTVLRPSPEKTKSNKIASVCQCICGEICIVANTNLVNEATSSCGCLARDAARIVAKDLAKINTKSYGESARNSAYLAIKKSAIKRKLHGA